MKALSTNELIEEICKSLGKKALGVKKMPVEASEGQQRRLKSSGNTKGVR